MENSKKFILRILLSIWTRLIIDISYQIKYQIIYPNIILNGLLWY